MKKGSLRMQFMAAGSATLVYFITGAFAGWASPSIARLLAGKDEPHLTPDEASWVVSLPNFAQVFTCIPSGFLADIIGRKNTLLISAVPFLLSWVLVIFAKSATMLIVARAIAGFGIGISSTAAPMYLGEIAEDRVRGTLTTAFLFMMNLGLVFEQCVGPYVSKTVLGILSAIFPVLFVITFIWMPESPYYFLMKDQKDCAKKSLMRLRCAETSETIQEELNKMEQFVKENMENKAGVKDLILDKGNRKGLFIITGLFIFQNLSGIIAIISYSTIIFQQSEIKLDPEIAVILMGVIQIFFLFIATSTVDMIGRRPLLLVSSVVCALSLGTEGTFFFLKHQGTNLSGYDWVPVAAMAVYMTTFTFGVGPIPIAIMSEIFPNNVKGIALSIGAILVAVGAAVVSRLYQVMADAWGVHVVFWLFAVCTAVGTVFAAVMAPETRGKTLMEIRQQLLSSKGHEISTNIENIPGEST